MAANGAKKRSRMGWSPTTCPVQAIVVSCCLASRTGGSTYIFPLLGSGLRGCGFERIVEKVTLDIPIVSTGRNLSQPQLGGWGRGFAEFGGGVWGLEIGRGDFRDSGAGRTTSSNV